jgi:hypothetical protein
MSCQPEDVLVILQDFQFKHFYEALATLITRKKRWKVLQIKYEHLRIPKIYLPMLKQ